LNTFEKKWFSLMQLKGLFKTLRAKLWASFLGFFSITLALIFVSIWFEYQQSKIEEVFFLVNKIELNIKEVNRLERDFFIDETINPNFYKNKQSNFISERKNKIHNIQHYLDTLQAMEKSGKWQFSSISLDSLKQSLIIYENIFDNLVDVIFVRGFKDYGVEGQMRDYIHAIEEAPYDLDKAKMLTLRRHEKDFIIRKEAEYIKKMFKAVKNFEKEIKAKLSNEGQRETFLLLLEQYHDSFRKLAQLDEKIGFNKNQGMRGELSVASQEVLRVNQLLTNEIRQDIDRLRTQISILFGVAVFVGLTTLIILSWRLTKWLSNPIQELSVSIRYTVQHRFAKNDDIPHLGAKDEIGQLARDFSFMLQTVRDSLDNIEKQKEKLKQEQKFTMDSIRYAKQIQRAILPDNNDLDYYLNDYYIMYLPRDVVSGDFYWFSKKKNYLFYALVDCTGHGVPGAFMSMIAHSLLNKIVNENNFTDPAFILETLSIEVNMALNQEKSKNTDGMDIALLAIDQSDSKNPKVFFAGAKQNLLYLQHNKLMEIRGTRRSLGGTLGKRSYMPFETQEVPINMGDSIYLFSDGLPDQPNTKRKKYGYKHLKKTLNECWHLPLKEQGDRVKKSLEKHMKKTKQRDDITFLAIRL